MIVDSSAILSVLFREPDHERVRRHLTRSTETGVGAATAVETSLVLISRMGTAGPTLLERFFRETSITVLPVTAAHWPVAADAFIRFGKGRHPAALNFGDCLTYAVARVEDQPLLCVGDDFPRTDLVLVR